MIAAQVFAEGSWVCGSDFLADEAPPLGEVTGGTSQFKVIDISDQKQPKAVVDIARTPCGNFNEPNLREVFMAMPFPIPSRVWMAIKGQHKRADRVLVSFPGWWSAFGWKPDPCRGVTPQPALDIGLFSIGLLHRVPGDKPVCVRAGTDFRWLPLQKRFQRVTCPHAD